MAKLTGPYTSQNNATAISSHFIFIDLLPIVRNIFYRGRFPLSSTLQDIQNKTVVLMQCCYTSIFVPCCCSPSRLFIRANMKSYCKNWYMNNHGLRWIQSIFSGVSKKVSENLYLILTSNVSNNCSC